jgi:hypothetical protein
MRGLLDRSQNNASVLSASSKKKKRCRKAARERICTKYPKRLAVAGKNPNLACDAWREELENDLEDYRLAVPKSLR